MPWLRKLPVGSLYPCPRLPGIRVFASRRANCGQRMGVLTFFSAFSTLSLGTPDDLAALRTAASAAFVLGSVEPPATGEGETDRREPGPGTYIGLRPQCPDDMSITKECAVREAKETYPGGFAIYHRFLYVIGTLLGCDFGPLERLTLSRQVKRFTLSLCCDRRAREWSSKMRAGRGCTGMRPQP